MVRSAQEHVEEMLAAGAPFEHIEAYLDGRRDLTDAQRSALWLLAWAETSPDERRRTTREVLTAVTPACERLTVSGGTRR